MRIASGITSRADKWLVFFTVSLAFFFLNLSTFASLGVALYSMVSELHWTMTAAGFSFSVLGLACGLSSPLPALCLQAFGGRMTLFCGCLLLLVGFVAASLSQSIALFYLSMMLVGLGFSLAGNVPGVYLLAEWFTTGSSRIIGLYLMFGALGAACGPLIVEAIVSGHGGWRSHWRWMAVTAGVISVCCLTLVRDAKRPAQALPIDGAAAPSLATEPQWTSRAAIFTWQFLLAAASMTMTMTTVTTYSSMIVTHLVKLGATPTAGALLLSVIAVAATVLKGVAGRLCELMRSAHVLGLGLVCQAVGSVLLAHADTVPFQMTGAIAFGVGWGLAYVAGTVVMLDFFGGATGAKILSIVWLLTTIAAAGPSAAGMVADRSGTFVSVFWVYSALLVALAIPVFLMRAPVRRDLRAPHPAPVTGTRQHA